MPLSSWRLNINTKFSFYELGSMAAVSQSSVGNLVAGSLISICQSAAMGGFGTANVGGVTQVAGGTVALLAGIKSWLG